MATALLLCVLPFSTPPAESEPNLASRTAPNLGSRKAQSSEISVSTARWEMRYSAALGSTLPADVLQRRIDAAADFVEQEFGPFKRIVFVEVMEELQRPDARPIYAGIGGFAGERNGETFIRVRADVASTSKFRHELLHAWLRQAEIRPPRGLEEGLAELIEHPFNGDMYGVLLRENGPLPLPLARLLRPRPGPQERLVRASFWVSMLYLRHQNPELPLKALLKYELLPDSAEAWEWLQSTHTQRTF